MNTVATSLREAPGTLYFDVIVPPAVSSGKTSLKSAVGFDGTTDQDYRVEAELRVTPAYPVSFSAGLAAFTIAGTSMGSQQTTSIITGSEEIGKNEQKNPDLYMMEIGTSRKGIMLAEDISTLDWVRITKYSSYTDVPIAPTDSYIILLSIRIIPIKRQFGKREP